MIGKITVLLILLPLSGLSYSYENDSFFKAAQTGNIMKMRGMITFMGVDVNFQSERPGIAGRTALHIAADKRQYDVVAYLLEKGADPNIKDKYGNPPLKFAVRNIKITKLLVESGAVINDRGERGSSSLTYAKATNSLDSLSFLISKGANVNADSILCFSGYKKKLIKTAEILIRSGSKINTVYENGWSPLHCASRNNEYLTSYLISVGADVNIRGENGETPLFVAAFNTIPTLVEKGANLEIVDDLGNTPIFSLVFKRKRVAALIEAGANVNHINKYGVSPLIAQALRNSDPKILKLLLDAGADKYHRVTTAQINDYKRASSSNGRYNKYDSSRDVHSAYDIYKDVFEKKYKQDKNPIYKSVLDRLAAE
ncbi:ankyrin repeat domain-containing protein [Pontibacterium sp.]|uniref:ankyrin repeat domain-containing protein n=1 Tax=Pontibacterium sp. TaxID=2036026 RepID=UPI0035194990